MVDPVERALWAVAAHGLRSGWTMPDQPFDDDDWRKLTGAVTRERLSGLLVAAIRDGALPVTDAQLDEAADLQRSSAVSAVQLEQLVLEVTTLLTERRIDYRVLKGPAVAHTVYADPALREFGDIDVLVRSEDFDRTVAALLDAGNDRPVPALRPGFDRRFGKGATLRTPESWEIDVHRTFVAGPIGLMVCLDDLFASASTFTLCDQRILALSPEHRFLHACIHGGLGRPARLSSLRDVAEMAISSPLDKDQVMAAAQNWGVLAVVARAVRLTWDRFALGEETALSSWAAGFRPERREQKIVDIYVAGDGSYARQAIAGARVVPGIAGKASYLRAILLPTDGHLASRQARRAGHLRQGLRHLRPRRVGQ